MYIRCMYGIFGREITKYTVIYGVYIRFWPTLYVQHSVVQHGGDLSYLWQSLFYLHAEPFIRFAATLTEGHSDLVVARLPLTRSSILILPVPSLLGSAIIGYTHRI